MRRLLAGTLLFACASGPRIVAEPGAVEHGLASWYGEDHRGRSTANGDRFDPDGYTAAHKTLPMGTWVRVVNLKNRRSVVVRINDRGPYARGRIVDLAKAPAADLDMLRDGVVPVRVEVLERDR